MGALFGKV